MTLENALGVLRLKHRHVRPEHTWPGIDSAEGRSITQATRGDTQNAHQRPLFILLAVGQFGGKSSPVHNIGMTTVHQAPTSTAR